MGLQLYLLVRVWSPPVSRLRGMEPGRSSRRRVSICPGHKAVARARVVRPQIAWWRGPLPRGLSGPLGLGLGRGAAQGVGHVAFRNGQVSDDCQLVRWG